MFRAALLAAMPAALMAANCDCTLPSGKVKSMNPYTCKDKKGTCAGGEAGEAAGGANPLLRANTANTANTASREALALALARKEKMPIKAPPVADNAKFEALLSQIKSKCAGEDKAFRVGEMCEHDQCVVREVATLLRDNVDIMDCKFGGEDGSVSAMCKAAPNGKNTPWKACPTRWDAYSNEGACAAKGLDQYDGKLTAYAGFVGQTPDDVRLKFPGDAERYRAKKRDIMNLAAKYQFNDIVEKGCAVCATVAQGGFHAYKAAGLLGRIDVVEEDYGGSLGHIFLLYSTRNEKPSSADNACGRGWTKATCYTQFIDNWYGGLTTAEGWPAYLEGMLTPESVEPCEVGTCSIPYALRTEGGGYSLDFHRQNKWGFDKPRNNEDPAVHAWPKTKPEKPTREGWNVEWYPPAQNWYFQKDGEDDVWADDDAEYYTII